jgi:LysM repeat protein
MSELTDKYGPVFIMAKEMGVENLSAQEDNGHMTITGNCPTAYHVNQLWDKVKEIDPNLSAGDLTVNLTTVRQDIYGEYEVQPGDTLSGIAKEVTRGQLSYQQIFEANRDVLSDPNRIQPGQRLKIPNFAAGKSA